MARLIGLLLVCVTACGNITRKNDGDAGVVRDDAPKDAPMTDMMTNVAPTPARELLPGGTRMTGATYTFDVQLGHPYKQDKASGPTYTIQGNAAVKP